MRTYGGFCGLLCRKRRDLVCYGGNYSCRDNCGNCNRDGNRACNGTDNKSDR